MLAALSVLLAELSARAGAAPLGLAARGRGAGAPRPEIRLGLRVLLGASTLGMAYLGLAATGIFFPRILVAAPLILAAGSRAGWSRSLLLAGALPACRAAGWPGVALAAAAGLTLVPGLLSLRFDIDAQWYELGAPWQYLEAHRLLLDHVPDAFHLPALAGLVPALAFALGDDRLARWFAIAGQAAALLVFAGFAARRSAAAAPWLLVLFALSTHGVPFLSASGKSDIPAAALAVAGALTWLDGPRPAAALLLGCAIAAKPVVAPLCLLWVLAFPPPRGRRVYAIGLVAAPVIPWAALSWLATGNPVYRLGWELIPTLGWDARNAAANAVFHLPLCDAGTMRVLSLPGALVAHLAREHWLLLPLLPFLLVWSRHRRAAWVALGGIAAILATFHVPRFALAPEMIVLALASIEIARRSIPLRVVAGTGLAVLVAIRALTDPQFPRVAMRELVQPPAKQWAAILTTRAGAYRALGETRRVLAVAELPVYPLPARAVYGGTTGETPSVWSIVHASRTPGDLDRRIRQLGCRLLLYNFVSADWIAVRYEGFAWNPRMVALWLDWCRGRLVLRWRSDGQDYFNGGFHLYEILDRPLARPPRSVWFLPGAESLWGEAFRLEGAGRQVESLAAFRRIMDAWPAIGSARAMVGHAYARLGDQRNAARYLR